MTSSLTFLSMIVKGFVSFSLLPCSLPFLSLLFSFLETTTALKNALGKKEKERRRQMRNRRKNKAKTFSLLLLMEKGASVGEGAPIGKDETAERKTLSLSHLMQMGCTLPDEMAPDQTGRGLGMAHHYRMPTTTAHRAQEPKRHRTQAALRFPRRDLEKPKT